MAIASPEDVLPPVGSLGAEYDPRISLGLGEHAQAAYSGHAGYVTAVRAAGWTDGIILSAGSCQVGVAWAGEILVVAARGSSAPGDWWRDFMSIWKKRWPHAPRRCRVGRGFRRQALDIMPSLLNQIRLRQTAMNDVPLQIAVTGHSLGAALVPLIVSALGDEHIHVMVAYAFEMPRTGNRKWAQWYDRNFTLGHTPTWSIVHAPRGVVDLVTRLPKRAWGFLHLGRRALLLRGAVYLNEAAESNWRLLQEADPVEHRKGIKRWRFITRLILSLRAHPLIPLLATLRKRLMSPEN